MSRNLRALTLLDLSGPAWPVMVVLYLFLYSSLMDTVQISRGREAFTIFIGEVTPRYIRILPATKITEYILKSDEF
jgi:hypothetical protein